MNQKDVYRILDALWCENEDAVRCWIKEEAKTAKILRRAEKQISNLEQAKVLR